MFGGAHDDGEVNGGMELGICWGVSVRIRWPMVWLTESLLEKIMTKFNFVHNSSQTKFNQTSKSFYQRLRVTRVYLNNLYDIRPMLLQELE